MRLARVIYLGFRPYPECDALVRNEQGLTYFKAINTIDQGYDVVFSTLTLQQFHTVNAIKSSSSQANCVGQGLWLKVCGGQTISIPSDSQGENKQTNEWIPGRWNHPTLSITIQFANLDSLQESRLGRESKVAYGDRLSRIKQKKR